MVAASIARLSRDSVASCCFAVERVRLETSEDPRFARRSEEVPWFRPKGKRNRLIGQFSAV
jgi:hypothetical protein